MQKKKSKKIQRKSNSQNIKKSEGIFNYDLEVTQSESKKKQMRNRKTSSSNKSFEQENLFQLEDLNENLRKSTKTKNNTNNKIKGNIKKNIKNNDKNLKKLKKKKAKEKKKKLKELQKLEKQEIELENKKIRKRINPKKLERIKKRNRIIKYACIVAVISIAIILFLLSPVFNIKEVEITGNEKVSKAEIVSLLNIGENTNIFKQTKRSVMNKLKENAYIESVDVRRVLPSKLIITIQERVIEYMLEFGNGYAYIDNKGNILEISKDKIDGKINIQGYTTSIESVYVGGKLCEEDLQKMKTVRKITSAAQNAQINSLITSINISDKNDYTMYLESEKKTVHLGDATNLDMKMLYVKKIIEVEKGKEGEIFVNRDLNNKKSYFRETM